VECASRGWNLFLTDLDTQALDTLADGLRKSYGVTVVPRACDLTEAQRRAELFDWINGRGLRFWGLINVAGTDFEGPFFEQSSQQIRTIVRLNVEGTLEMIHATLARRDPMAPFRIINVASLAAFFPMPVKATYAASKRFLLDFSLALRNEVRGLGATVTVLCPAGLPTTPGCVQAIEAQGMMGYLHPRRVESLPTNCRVPGARFMGRQPGWQALGSGAPQTGCPSRTSNPGCASGRNCRNKSSHPGGFLILQQADPFAEAWIKQTGQQLLPHAGRIGYIRSHTDSDKVTRQGRCGAEN
jgi:NADP-dependent 3-hydroxy acid dehydrogenase YdfG